MLSQSILRRLTGRVPSFSPRSSPKPAKQFVARPSAPSSFLGSFSKRHLATSDFGSAAQAPAGMVNPWSVPNVETPLETAPKPKSSKESTKYLTMLTDCIKLSDHVSVYKIYRKISADEQVDPRTWTIIFRSLSFLKKNSDAIELSLRLLADLEKLPKKESQYSRDDFAILVGCMAEAFQKYPNTRHIDKLLDAMRAATIPVSEAVIIQYIKLKTKLHPKEVNKQVKEILERFPDTEFTDTFCSSLIHIFAKAKQGDIPAILAKIKTKQTVPGPYTLIALAAAFQSDYVSSELITKIGKLMAENNVYPSTEMTNLVLAGYRYKDEFKSALDWYEWFRSGDISSTWLSRAVTYKEIMLVHHDARNPQKVIETFIEGVEYGDDVNLLVRVISAIAVTSLPVANYLNGHIIPHPDHPNIVFDWKALNHPTKLKLVKSLSESTKLKASQVVLKHLLEETSDRSSYNSLLKVLVKCLIVEASKRGMQDKVLPLCKLWLITFGKQSYKMTDDELIEFNKLHIECSMMFRNSKRLPRQKWDKVPDSVLQITDQV